MNDDTIQNGATGATASEPADVNPTDRLGAAENLQSKSVPQRTRVDLFVSYNQTDRHWAAGIAGWLKEAGHAAVLQSQDFVAGSNFVSEMNAALSHAGRIIAVASPDYFAAPFPESEWTAAFARDPTGSGRSLIMVRIRECDMPPLLKPLVYIDLCNLGERAARERFLSEIEAVLANVRVPRRRRTQSPNVVLFPAPNRQSIHQEIRGNGNVQSVNVFTRPPVIRKVVERREGSLTSQECRQVQAWIEDLAEGTIGMSRPQAYGMWWARFKSALGVEKYEELSSSRMGEASEWHRVQRAMQTRRLKTAAPDVWRRKRIVVIKAVMGEMGVAKQDYYPDVARRLRIRKPFVSLNDLTKQDLDRVYTMALRDRGMQ